MSMERELSKDVMRLNRELLSERLNNQNLRTLVELLLDELGRRDRFGGRVSEEQFSLLATDAGALQ